MPEFVTPERRPDEAITADADGAEPRLRGFGWRHVAIAALVGAVLGAGLPVALRAADRSADDRSTSLRALASEYVQAIADGDSERATELVPLEIGLEAAPAPVLASAWRIRLVSTAEPHIDGSEGSVDVRYQVGGTDVERTLRATLTPAGWRLTTSLAEPADTRALDSTVELRVAGVALPAHGGLHLYPAVYRLDVVEGPLFVSGGGAFTVDGDPRTATVVEAASGLMPAFEERLVRLAIGAVDACRERPDCVIRTSAPFTQTGPASVLEAFDDGRAIDLKVPVVARDDAGWEWRDVIVRVGLDSRGLPVEWHCSMPGQVELLECDR